MNPQMRKAHLIDMDPVNTTLSRNRPIMPSLRIRYAPQRHDVEDQVEGVKVRVARRHHPPPLAVRHDPLVGEGDRLDAHAAVPKIKPNLC